MSSTTHTSPISPPPGHQDPDARLAASAEVTQVGDTITTEEQIAAWHESQTEDFLRGMFDRFGAHTPRQVWAAYKDGQHVKRCARCASHDLEEYCHLFPDPIFACRSCGAKLNADASVIAEETGIDDNPKCRYFARWLLEEMARIEAEILAFDCSGRGSWPEVAAQCEALVRQQLECQAALRQYARFVSEKNR